MKRDGSGRRFKLNNVLKTSRKTTMSKKRRLVKKTKQTFFSPGIMLDSFVPAK